MFWQINFAAETFIVFVWSQYGGANIEQQRTIGYGGRQNQVAKLKVVGGDLYCHQINK